MYRYIYINYIVIEIDSEGMEDTTERHIAILRDDNYIDIEGQVHNFFMNYLSAEPVHKHAPGDWYDWYGGNYIIDLQTVEGISTEEYELLLRLHIVGSPVMQRL